MHLNIKDSLLLPGEPDKDSQEIIHRYKHRQYQVGSSD